MAYVRGQAYAKLGLRPWEFGRLAPGDLREMLEAVEEERSIQREWIAGLVAQMISILVPDPKRLKKRKIDPEDLMGRSDRTRSAQRYRRHILAERERDAREGRLPVRASPDWGAL